MASSIPAGNQNWVNSVSAPKISAYEKSVSDKVQQMAADQAQIIFERTAGLEFNSERRALVDKAIQADVEKGENGIHGHLQALAALAFKLASHVIRKYKATDIYEEADTQKAVMKEFQKLGMDDDLDTHNFAILDAVPENKADEVDGMLGKYWGKCLVSAFTAAKFGYYALPGSIDKGASI